MSLDADNTAILSDCQQYRYRLERRVNNGSKVFAFFGVNPSTADAFIDDATVKKWRGFSYRLGADKFIVGNVFAYRSTDVQGLSICKDPIGPDNKRYIDQIIKDADVLVPCWGNTEKVHSDLSGEFINLILKLLASGKPVKCFGRTKNNSPKHPLMLAYTTPLVDFTGSTS